ncbi:MAG: beta-glucosidase family protein [Candidatus Dormibacteraceae bacterium]
MTAVGAESSEETIQALVARLDLEQKVRLLTGDTTWTVPGEPAIGLRSIVVSDGPAGVRGTAWDERDSSASLPSPTAIAAAWDLDRAGRLGGLLAAEARRKGVDVVLGPTVNIQRSPRGGRHFEAYSEDPWLSGQVGTALVRGLQAQGVGATPKHLVANDSETDRMNVDVRVDERTLREVYLQPFERLVEEGGAWLVMSSYNAVNGTTMSANDLLRSPLKDEWGFDGVVVSVWGGVRDTEAAGRAAQDLAMPGPSGVWGPALVEAVREGRVEEAAIDDKVVRLLRLAARVGALQGIPADGGPPRRWAPGEVRALLREAAADGMVLVRNRGVLPLDPASRPRVAVLGEHAAHGRNQGGGSAFVYPDHVVSPLQGLRRAFGEDRVTYRPGVRSQAGILPFDSEVARDPATGDPGLRVRLLGADGEVLRDEVRSTGRLTWIGDAILHRTTLVQVEATFVAPREGRYELGFAGLGQFRLDVGGTTRFDGLALPDRDTVVSFLAPPARSFPVELEAGEKVRVELRHVPHVTEAAATVIFTLGFEEPLGEPKAALEEAIRAAAEADCAVVVVGTTEALEAEGFDRRTLALPGGQDELVRRAVAANPRTVVLVNSGGPVLLPWLEQAPAVLLTWFPGQEMGDAIADVLTGRAEPGGRMTTTWAAREADVPVWQVDPVEGSLHYSERLNVGYREWTRRARSDGPRPAIPFGHGLGYTAWELGEVALATDGARTSGIDVTVPVRNTGPRPGKQVVQVYCSRVSESQVERPVLWLAGFATVRADPGAEVEARIHLAPRSLEHWSVERHAWELEPGTYAVRVGTSVAELGEAVEFTIHPSESARPSGRPSAAVDGRSHES